MLVSRFFSLEAKRFLTEAERELAWMCSFKSNCVVSALSTYKFFNELWFGKQTQTYRSVNPALITIPSTSSLFFSSAPSLFFHWVRHPLSGSKLWSGPAVKKPDLSFNPAMKIIYKWRCVEQSNIFKAFWRLSLLATFSCLVFCTHTTTHCNSVCADTQITTVDLFERIWLVVHADF